MEITSELLEAAFTAKPEVITSFIEGKGFKVLKAEEITKRDEELKGRWIGEKTNEFYTSLDKDIEEVHGVKRPADKKTYDWNKELHLTSKTRIKELEEAVKKGSTDETVKAQLEQLRGESANYKKALEDKDKQLFEKDVKLELRDGLRELKFNSTIPDGVKNTYINAITNDLLKSAIVEGEKVVFKIDGRVKLDDKGLPASANFILKELLTDILDKEVKANGAGSGQAGSGEQQGPITNLPAEVTNQQKLGDYLLKLGLKQGTPDYDKIWGKFAKSLPLR